MNYQMVNRLSTSQNTRLLDFKDVLIKQFQNKNAKWQYAQKSVGDIAVALPRMSIWP